MLFVQFRFFIFFVIVFAIYWALRTNRSRKFWLLLCSHFFYACLFIGGPDSANADTFPAWTFYQKLINKEALPIGWWFPAVLWASTIMDYIVGLGIGRSKEEWRRRAWLLVSVCVNLGVLGFFKYYNWGIESVSAALEWMGLPTSRWTLEIFLPYGISFYTFQSLSYSIDVYRRRLEPVQHFLDLAFFISFFPQLVAGPIVRAMTFLPQVWEKRVWASVNVRACVALFFIGYIKKACISDNVAPVVDAYFSAPGTYNLYSSFIGVLFYAVQVYCDFSGYTDMAIASSRLLGYELTPNFNFPYFSASITDFWRRWHISLGTWLRDYLYISLGGNRGTALFAFRNLMLTMLLGGLWHGASWNFVIWGGLNGLALAFHRYWEAKTADWGAAFKKLMNWVAVPITFYVFLVTLVFVRAYDVRHEETGKVILSGTRAAAQTLSAICLFQTNGQRTFTIHCLWVFVVIAIIHYANYRGWLSTWWQRIPYWLFAALIGVGFAAALVFVPAEYKPFIYFQF